MVNLFDIAVAKKNTHLIEKLLPYQNLSNQEKYTIINKFMKTSNDFILPLIQEINNEEELQKLLCNAILFNNVSAVHILLKKGANPNKPKRSGQLPLHLAISSNNKELIELLLKFGADVNGKNKWNHTPMYLAAWYGYMDLMKYFEEKGALLNEDVLQAAACANQFKVVDYLLKRGLKLSDEIYFKVIMLNRLEMATYLFERDSKFQLNNNCDYPVLLIAVNKNYQHLVEGMIKHGLPKEYTDRREICSRALFAAIESGHFHFLPLLVKHGADINYIYEHETPLDAAIKSGNTTIIKWLKERGGTRSNIRRIYT